MVRLFRVYMTHASTIPLSIGLSVSRFLPGVDHDILVNHDEQALSRDGKYVRLLRRLLQMEKGLESLCAVFKPSDGEPETVAVITELSAHHAKAAETLVKLIMRNQSVPSIG